jgi:hypothetical protein
VQPFLDVRTAVLNNTLEDAFSASCSSCHRRERACTRRLMLP